MYCIVGEGVCEGNPGGRGGAFARCVYGTGWKPGVREAGWAQRGEGAVGATDGSGVPSIVGTWAAARVCRCHIYCFEMITTVHGSCPAFFVQCSVALRVFICVLHTYGITRKPTRRWVYLFPFHTMYDAGANGHGESGGWRVCNSLLSIYRICDKQ